MPHRTTISEICHDKGLTASNKTIEGLFPEIKNELREIKKEIKALKENTTTDTGN